MTDRYDALASVYTAHLAALVRYNEHEAMNDAKAQAFVDLVKTCGTMFEILSRDFGSDTPRLNFSKEKIARANGIYDRSLVIDFHSADAMRQEDENILVIAIMRSFLHDIKAPSGIMKDIDKRLVIPINNTIAGFLPRHS